MLNGNQRVEGVELGAQRLSDQALEIFAGYTYLDGKTLSSGTAGLCRQGAAERRAQRAQPVDRIRVDRRLGGRRSAATGSASDSPTAVETATIPGYVVWNAMASYKLSKDVSLQLNGFNLFNRLYYDNAYYTSAAENHVIPGAGRSAKLSIRATF